MPGHLEDHLITARKTRFVGRTAERDLFRSALLAAELPFHVLYTFGPGGVGKTTLLAELVDLCAEVNVPFLRLDGRDIDASPEPFLAVLGFQLGLPVGTPPVEALAASNQRQVLFIDTYERLSPLDRWLREELLPHLSAQLLVVIADRYPPSLSWRADPGMQAVTRLLPLRNLSPEESRAYLVKRAIPEEHHKNILSFTHGHPLALSLVADVYAQHPGVVIEPETSPDIVQSLLERLLQEWARPSYRMALEACALVRMMTEALLDAMLDLPDSHELFDWLRGLSFIESGRFGIFPHDLARDALVADLRWRNPDWYDELTRRARAYYSKRLELVSGPDQQAVLIDYIYLHRNNPIVRPFFERFRSQQRAIGGVSIDVARQSDWPVLVEMVRRYEGDESARLAEYWFSKQPQGITVLRDDRGHPAGFLATIALQATSSEDRQVDLAVDKVWQYLLEKTPLRPGEEATFFRFWMARDSYQSISPSQVRLSVQMVHHYLTTPKLAFSFLPCAEPEFWDPIFSYVDLMRIPEADFEIADRSYGVYGHDWRAVPRAAWLDLLAERETALAPQAITRPPASEPLVVLSRPAFAQAVRDALNNWQQPEILSNSPLLRSRFVLDKSGPESNLQDRLGALLSMVKEACETLQATPRGEKFYRALYHTYLHPAPSQESAAELLDIPYSTFRRHLKAGLERVTGILWQRELRYDD
jgi:hypothetical protein